tara:strand:- start:6078 stop:8123 length:2046 start_codon:yes stop_codon:yes gene_type:complete
MKFKLICISICIFIINNTINAQINHNCGQHIVLKKLLSDSIFKKRYEKEQFLIQQKSSLKQFDRGNIFKVPVVFHVVHNNGIEKISREQVLDALENLNIDLRALRADTATVDSLFKSIIADVEVEFVLATKAPDGTCFSGITYTESAYSYNNGEINGSDQLNAVINYNDVYQGIWPGNMYLNVLICGSVGDGIAGYSYYPNGTGSSMDWGIWLRHDYCGSIGTGSPSASKTFVHEVGHWLNLPHTWGSTNEPNLIDNCNSDDGVEDTPNTIGSTWCNYNEITCGEVSNIENHMEYSSCRKMFTIGQKDRMRTALTSPVGGRSNLITPSNHQLTGIDIDPPFCKTDFFAENYVTCSGDSLLFIDQSFHNPIFWDWYFEGGNPNFSTLQNAYSQYTTPGSYDVSLTASGDSLNYITEFKNDRVIVMDYNGEQLPYFEGFENTDLSIPSWILNSGDWSVTNTASFSGTNCLKISNLGYAEGTKHILESKTFDLSDSLKAYFSFKYAFAKRNDGNNDNLKILASKDCGKTWSVRKVIQYSQLTTAPNQTNFVPSNGEWKEAIVSSIIGPYCVSNFRFKFEFTSGGGNDLFIDDINISLEDNTNVLKVEKNEILIFPNPTSNRLNINSLLPIETVQVFDLSGKMIIEMSGVQKNETSIDIAFFSKGFYSVTINTNSGKFNRSFMKN